MPQFRTYIVPAAICGLSLIACSQPAAVSSAQAAAPVKTWAISKAQLPHIKPGRWLMRTTSFKGSKADRELLNEEPEYVCIEPGTSILETTETDLENCSKSSIQRSAAGYVVEAQCSTPDVQSSIKSSYSGDFQTSMKADIELGLAPAGKPLESVRIGLEGRYQGPCQGDED